MTIDPKQAVFAEVLLPLAIAKTYTYGVPVGMASQLRFGVRVEVPLRNKLYSGIIIEIHHNRPIAKLRHIISVIDDAPIINDVQFSFWNWVADYYCATLGEVMNVALPSGLKLTSETKLLLNSSPETEGMSFEGDESIIIEALSIQQELSIAQIQDILDKKTVYPSIKSLMSKRVVVIKEELQSKFKSRTEAFLKFEDHFGTQVDQALALTTRSEKQSRAILGLAALLRRQKEVSRKTLYEFSDVDNAAIKALEKKGIVHVYQREVSRIDLDMEPDEFRLSPLSPAQDKALHQVKEVHESGRVALLHGITGSGKTRIYVELILEVLANGGQVLLMLPEIALTAQIVARLESQIGKGLLVYHSRVNDHQRVEVWNAALYASKLFIGARSALFLPFSDLQLIIVDEEHDRSYKQDSPNPKYNGRDSAVKLSILTGAKVVLGSATPSLESRYNCETGKYGYIPLTERYGPAVLPQIEIIDLKKAYKEGRMKQQFSTNLISAIQEAMARKEQTIIFQNRRGYAPILKCQTCGWTAECPSCDITLTYHQRVNDLKCHYCGYRQRKPQVCPNCGSHEISLLGAGTERLEESIEELIPGVRVARFDYDTTRSKRSQEKILTSFKDGKLDVLVGTQMLTKGFDFDNISLVGVMNADALLGFPNFRASERSFQLLMQVAGRAGRRNKQGKVLIQAYAIDHPVLAEVTTANYDRYYSRELVERRTFVYPPLFYLIAVWFRHKDLTVTKECAKTFEAMLQPHLGARLQGPADPGLIRVRNKYQQVIYLRVEKQNQMISKAKSLVIEARNRIKQTPKWKSVQVSIDVDPQ